jgi:hypothetical protein
MEPLLPTRTNPLSEELDWQKLYNNIILKTSFLVAYFPLHFDWQ